uniref:CD109 molecule n=1 Tax=Amphilophus citrinellus TaxID=61819 RepID=A0A3Q0SE27_AMPCI
PSYLLLAPSTLQPGIPTSVSVTILKASPVSVSARIIHGNQTVASKSATVEGGIINTLIISVLMNFPVLLQINESKSPTWESYMLEVEGHTGGVQVFSNSTKLHLDLRGVSTFIQTDKVNYLPGQAVKIRAVSIQSDGRPFVSPVDIIIRDPRGNLLRQWPAADSVLGVVSKEYLLSENPPLGQWTIVTTVKVSHKVRLWFHAVCLYTYGKPVQGHLNITFIYYFHGTDESYYEDREVCVSVQRLCNCLGNLCILSVKVKSRGQVVSAGKSSSNLTLVPEVSWGPLACIIIYCVHPSGEVLNDAIQLPITQLLKNQVSLRWSSAVRRPAEDVTLKVNVSEPDSLVGILVVDKATRWAGSHNDITKETVGRPAESLLVYSMNDPPVEERRERLYFPETWIWMDINTSNSNTKEIPLTVPDSITTWTATAFVMSENLGLGIVEQPAELTVFQDFFLSLNLPAFIIRGEELVLEIILFNYLQQDQKVTVSVAQSETFEFVFPDNEQLSTPGVHQVFVKNESGATVLIPIRPLVLGEIPVSVQAKSEAASDFVRTTVLVKAEGLEQSFSTSLLLELSPSQLRLSRNVTFTFPPDVVAGSERASVMAVGDILGPSISGLDSLIQMPYGCGEQNMINFAPNIYILRYLSATGQDDQKITNQAINYMMKGYEQELSFQRADGSFSAFGDQDSSGSTWLSAFVLRCFLQARPFISIDSHVLHSAAAWIATQYGDDGSFLEPGRVIHTELQGGLDGPISLTAYVLIYKSEVSAALMYLETHLAFGVSSNYSLSLLTYALVLAGSSNAQSALDDLIGRADMRDGVPMWLSPDDGLSPSWQPRSSDIEMASYVLLSQHKLNLVSEGLSLMKWLSQQRNDRGGFGSTQDTVVALQALSTFAALRETRDTDVTIRVNTDSSTAVASFHINQENYLLHQSQQLNVFYNVRSEAMRRRRRQREVGEREAFELYVELVDSDVNSAHLLVSGLGLNATGMALMEAGLLSGFGLLPDGIQTGGVVKKVETQPGKVILYLDSVSCSQEMCVQIPLIIEHKVAKVQEATVVLYDYYEPSKTGLAEQAHMKPYKYFITA